MKVPTRCLRPFHLDLAAKHWIACAWLGSRTAIRVVRCEFEEGMERGSSRSKFERSLHEHWVPLKMIPSSGQATRRQWAQLFVDVLEVKLECAPIYDLETTWCSEPGYRIPRKVDEIPSIPIDESSTLVCLDFSLSPSPSPLFILPRDKSPMVGETAGETMAMGVVETTTTAVETTPLGQLFFDLVSW